MTTLDLNTADLAARIPTGRDNTLTLNYDHPAHLRAFAARHGLTPITITRLGARLLNLEATLAGYRVTASAPETARPRRNCAACRGTGSDPSPCGCRNGCGMCDYTGRSVFACADCRGTGRAGRDPLPAVLPQLAAAA